METKQLNNYKIEFYSEEEWNKLRISTTNIIYKDVEEGIVCIYNPKYAGLVSDISEELAELICKNDMNFCESINCNDILYINYQTKRHNLYTAKESFQTLSELPYCVIKLISE